jgi:hypothetical protein
MTLHQAFIPVSIPDHVASLVQPGCEICMGLGWVCEEHPLRPWETGYPADCSCGAPGMPCVCTGLQTAPDTPRV